MIGVFGMFVTDRTHAGASDPRTGTIPMELANMKLFWLLNFSASQLTGKVADG